MEFVHTKAKAKLVIICMICFIMAGCHPKVIVIHDNKKADSVIKGSIVLYDGVLMTRGYYDFLKKCEGFAIREGGP